MNAAWMWVAGAGLLVGGLAAWRLRARSGGHVPTPAATPPGIAGGSEPVAPAAPAAREPTSVPPLRQVLVLALDDVAAAQSGSLDPAANQILLAASQLLAQIGGDSRYTPRRPTLLPQLLEAIGDEEASLRGLSRIISQDPTLTGDLLRTANSPLYRASGSAVESIERAAAMLGTQGLRTLISAALVKPLANDGAGAGRFGEIVWEHSIYSASAAEAWAARAQDCDPFTAHLLGLMHGLGDVAVHRVLRDIPAARQAAGNAALVAHALDTHGAVTARRIAAAWGLSERTQEALEAQSAAAPALEVTPLAHALRFGRLAGALVLLCRHQQFTEAQALQQLSDAGFAGPYLERIWERLMRAYVRP